MNTIPRIIHQTHRLPSDQLGDPLSSLTKMVQHMHPHWEYRFYLDNDCLNYIEDHYPDALEVYQSIRIPVQRADLVRLIFVYCEGGFYLDVDMEMQKSLDDLLEHDCIFAEEVTLSENEASELGHQNCLRIANYMFGAKPGDEFIKSLIEEILERGSQIEINRFDDVLNSTGPGMVTDCYHAYPGKDQVTIIFNENNICQKCQTNRCCFGDYARHLHMGSWQNALD